MANAEHEGRITRNAGVLVALTTVSRVGGLIRETAISHYFGASGLTDVFYMAFTIPNVMRRLVAEGTMTAVVQPAYQTVRTRDGDAAARRFYAGMLGWTLVAVLLLSVLGVLGAPALVTAFASGFLDEPAKFAHCVELTRWLFPVVITMALVGISMAVLNAHDVYAVPALAPIVLNISMIAFTIIGALTFPPEHRIMGAVVGVLVGGVVQVLVQAPALARLGLLARPRLSLEPAVKGALLKFVPGLFGLAVYQLNIIVLRQLASYLDEGSVSYYNYADRLMEMAIGIFAIAIAQGSFTTMNEQAAGNRIEELKGTWRFAMSLTNLIALPAALGLGAIAVPITSVLYLHGAFTWYDVQQTASAALAFAPGLVAMSGTRATAQVFYALGDQRTPVVVSAFVLVSNLLIGVALLSYGVAGLALTLSLSSFIQTGLLVLLLRRKIGDLHTEKFVRPVALQALLSCIAVAAAYGVQRFGDWPRGLTPTNVVVLGVAVSAAMAIYGGGALLCKLEGVEQVAGGLTRRLRRVFGRR
ncbi:MAG: murein biosynthesis integral membrane protein MurJ [Deltaproteobacteria bacterium]|nr:murein biosynthesis integral membrane protein MurJ [Deltaproteobacteria bacterium]